MNGLLVGANTGRGRGHATTRREHSRGEKRRHLFGLKAEMETGEGNGDGLLLRGANAGREEMR